MYINTYLNAPALVGCGISRKYQRIVLGAINIGHYHMGFPFTAGHTDDVQLHADGQRKSAPPLQTLYEKLLNESVVSKMETTAADGKRYNTNYYNLEAIISVGYQKSSMSEPTAQYIKVTLTALLPVSKKTTDK